MDLYGFSALFYGGYIGIIFLIISLGYAYAWSAKKAIITNILGCIFLCINLLIWPIIAPTMVPSNGKYIGVSGGYYLAIISLIIFCLSLLFLIENRKVISKKSLIHESKIKNDEIKEKIETINCPFCNSEIIDKTSTFCNNCGSPLN